MAEDKKPLDDGRSKERRAQKTEMASLIKSLKASTESNKAESETVDMQIFLDQFKNSMKVGDTNIKALKVEFEKANEILNNQSSTAQEKELAQQQIEAIKENVESEEEKREKQKAQDEANSILNKMAGKLDSVAKGFDEFAGKAIGAGGLLAAAMLFINPELFFEKLQEAIQGINTIINSITMAVEGDFKGAWENLKENTEGLGLVLGTVALFVIGPIIRAVSFILKTFKAIGNGFKRVGNFFSRMGTFFTNLKNSKFFKNAPKLLGNIGKIVGKLFLPITAIYYAFQGILKGFNTEGTIMEKLEAGLKETWTGLVAFFIDLPKWLLGKIVGIFNKEKGTAILDFNTKEWLGNLSEKLFFGPSRAIRKYIGDKTSAATESIGNFFSDFSFTEFFQNIVNKITGFFSKIGEWIGNAMDAAIEKVLSIGEAISNFIKSILRAGLPDPTASVFSVAGAAAKIIPSAVYEYAGIDKETGERIPDAAKPPEEIATVEPNLQSDVLATSQENAQGQSAITTQTVVTSVTQQNSSSSSSSSSTVVNPTGNSMASMELAGATGGRR
jgi:hypothetical protein